MVSNVKYLKLKTVYIIMSLLLDKVHQENHCLTQLNLWNLPFISHHHRHLV